MTSSFLENLKKYADFFSKSTVRKILSGILSECQTVWIQVMLDVLSGLILVQVIDRLVSGNIKSKGNYSHYFLLKNKQDSLP